MATKKTCTWKDPGAITTAYLAFLSIQTAGAFGFRRLSTMQRHTHETAVFSDEAVSERPPALQVA